MTRATAWAVLVLAILLGARPMFAGAGAVFWLLLTTVLLVLLQFAALASRRLDGAAWPGSVARRVTRRGGMAALVDRSLGNDQRRFLSDRAGCHILSRQRLAGRGKHGFRPLGIIFLSMLVGLLTIFRRHHRQSLH